MPEELDNAFDSLCTLHNFKFPAIQSARTESDKLLNRLREIEAGKLGPEDTTALTTLDSSIVLFGSIARRECTSASDADWTLLIDGQADPQHQFASHEFRRRLDAAKFKKPGPTDVFGNLSFSHELIHCIGGESDSNTNLTRRILLLLESRSLGYVDAHSRVLRMILKRYLESERSFLTETGRKYKVPRFLFNDIVRFWRTMAVDYVNKQWTRGSDSGWAIRNVKLRFSRKLLFASGILMTFGCSLEKRNEEHDGLFKDEASALNTVHQHLTERIGTPPIDVLCSHLKARSNQKTAEMILGSYDSFLHCLNEPNKRKQLESLTPLQAQDDAVFKEMCKLSRVFQSGLNSMFYEDDAETRELMFRYGVF